jgi:hypothetical protein
MSERLVWLIEGLSSGIPAVLGAALMIAYGGALVWLLGVRRAPLIIVAALPVAISLVALTAAASAAIGVEASLPAIAIATLVVAGLTGLIPRLVGRDVIPQPADAANRNDRVPWVGAGIGAGLAIGAWIAGIGDFAMPPQGNDDIWHGYLVERITHMAAVAPSLIAPTFADSPVPTVYYPYGSHLLAALMHEVTHLSVAQALNGAWVVWIGAMLPVGMAASASVLFPRHPWTAFWSAVLSAGVIGFPYLTNGLFSFSVCLAMTPGFLAVLGKFLVRRGEVPYSVLILGALGLFMTHPAGALVAAALSGIVVVEYLLGQRSLGAVRDVASRLAIVVALTLLIALPWLLAVGTVRIGSPEVGAAMIPIPTAAWMFLTLASPWTPAQALVALFTAAGVAAALFTRCGVALAAAWLVIGVLYVGVLANVDVAGTLTVPWHGNWFRLFAALGLVVPLLAGLGLAGSAATVARRTRRGEWPRSVALGSIVLVAAGALAYGVAQGVSIARSAWHTPQLVTAADVELMSDLGEQLSPSDKVLNSPRDGSTWMYALFNITPVRPYVYGPEAQEYSQLLAGEKGFADAATQCRALADSGATYALVKDVRGDIAFRDYDVSAFVDRWPQLFTPANSNQAGTTYRINQEALNDCMER